MEEKLEIITKEDLEVLSKQAYESAKDKGFYPKDVTFCLMFIIVEMGEVLQADRKDRHGSIEDYESEIEMSRDIPTAYRNTLEGTVESEFADIAIRILSLLGSIMDSEKIEDLSKKCEFKPFDKVLVRDYLEDKWMPNFFSCYDGTSEYKYGCIAGNSDNVVFSKYCIPYNEETAKLIGTTNNVEG